MKEALDLSFVRGEKDLDPGTRKYFALMREGIPMLESEQNGAKPAVDALRRDGKIIGQYCFTAGGKIDTLLYLAGRHIPAHPHYETERGRT